MSEGGDSEVYETNKRRELRKRGRKLINTDGRRRLSSGDFIEMKSSIQTDTCNTGSLMLLFYVFCNIEYIRTGDTDPKYFRGTCFADIASRG